MLAPFRQKALLNNDVRDELVRSRVALRGTVGVLDDENADGSDEAVGTDLKNLARACIGSQHERDEGGVEQNAAIKRLRVKPNSPLARMAAVYSIRSQVVTKIAHQRVLGGAHTSVAHTSATIHRRLAIPTAAERSEPPLQRRDKPWHVGPEPCLDE